MQTITRTATFDAAHRVMNEKFKCFNLHGHTYKVELTFYFNAMEEIGYAIDFKEIKRVYLQWIDDMFDHGTIANPKDGKVISLCEELRTKLWIMSLNGDGYCNPTVENISREIFLGVNILTNELQQVGLHLYSVKLHETPNCFTECFSGSIPLEQQQQFIAARYDQLKQYAYEKGKVNYDDRH